MTPRAGRGDVLPLADTLGTLIRVVNKTPWLISTLSPASQSSGWKKKHRTFDSGALLEGGVEGFLVQVFVTAAWVEQFQFCVHRKMAEA